MSPHCYIFAISQNSIELMLATITPVIAAAIDIGRECSIPIFIARVDASGNGRFPSRGFQPT